MKYGVIDERAANKKIGVEFSNFDALVDFFEPDEELHEKWEDIQDLYDLEQFISFCNDGEAGYKVVEIAEDVDILKDSGLCDVDVKHYMKRQNYTIYPESEIVPNYEGMLLERGYDDEEERQEEVDKFMEMVKTGKELPYWGISKGLDKVYYIEFYA